MTPSLTPSVLRLVDNFVEITLDDDDDDDGIAVQMEILLCEHLEKRKRPSNSKANKVNMLSSKCCDSENHSTNSNCGDSISCCNS